MADDPREVPYAQERAELEAAIVKAVQGQYIGKPPPLMTGWAERAVAAVVTAGWLPPAAVAEESRASYKAGRRRGYGNAAQGRPLDYD